MPTEDTNNGSTEETSGQEQQNQSQATSGETPPAEQAQAQQVTIDDSTQLPETHPLVKTLAKQKQDLAAAKTALAEANAGSAKATQLQEELDKRPTPEALATLQTRYDRLEAFLQAAGGPLGRALDSRSFTRDLFETDKDITELVKAFNRANPSATSTALGSAGAQPSDGPVDPNKLLRAAFAGGKKS